MTLLSIRNPRTGQLDFQLHCMDAAQVADVAATLKQQQSRWFTIGLDKRIAELRMFAEALAQQKQAIITELCQDTGRYQESVLELDVTISAIERWCQQAPQLLNINATTAGQIPFLQISQGYLPYPLVGVISPWNFPLLLSLVDAIPALLAGSAVILKPSEVTSRFSQPLAKALQQCQQLSQVFRIVTGDGKTGAAVCDVADTICFTGSVKTGRLVAEHCAKRFIPAFLELGGKDPAIVCDDANIETAAKAICWGSMVNAGQSCMSIERAYVHADIYDAFVQRLSQLTAGLQHNYPDIKQGQIGPIIAASQVELVKHQLSDAIAKGANCITGGEVVNLGGGDYCQPTILTNVTMDMDILTKETFAATLAVVKVASNDQAIALANDSDYGLSAAVFSQDSAKAQAIAEQLQAGAISINDASLTALVHEAEKQSFKLSGLGGSRMGAESIRRFIRKKAYIENTGVASPWWF
ncbi:aldehyde dehydrogenase family protein [Thalassotalea sp. HSM 43]|uniref:aldehyde dehydrogenase family protein n=1 Tax=Thalassotalea sp. HSM 43 TaxID=2552945 RepID=UPI001080B7E9|nr:aldehyde dehydrogenase family protein [Thalassotalea sp. HSM 43]QBY04571.1 aldehyde dehydrogenase family protein [Thalassotalea sp. HSM 43]